MNIPFIEFNKFASIPLTPEYILKIGQAVDEAQERTPQIVINLTNTIIAKLEKDDHTYTQALSIFEYEQTSSGSLYKLGKIDVYGENSLQVGYAFTDLYQGPFKTYILKDGKVSLTEEGFFVFGKYEGEHKYYLDDCIEICSYINDVKHGPYLIKDYTDHIILEGSYYNNRKDGVWKLYYSNGIVKKLTHYSHYIEGLYGITQTFSEEGSLLTQCGNILEQVHGEYIDVKAGVHDYYLFNEKVAKEEYNSYDFKKQDELFLNINRSFLAIL